MINIKIKKDELFVTAKISIEDGSINIFLDDLLKAIKSKTSDKMRGADHFGGIASTTAYMFTKFYEVPPSAGFSGSSAFLTVRFKQKQKLYGRLSLAKANSLYSEIYAIRKKHNLATIGAAENLKADFKVRKNYHFTIDGMVLPNLEH